MVGGRTERSDPLSCLWVAEGSQSLSLLNVSSEQQGLPGRGWGHKDAHVFRHHVRGVTGEGIGGIKPGQREAWLANVCFLVSEGWTLVQVPCLRVILLWGLWGSRILSKSQTSSNCQSDPTTSQAVPGVSRAPHP